MLTTLFAALAALTTFGGCGDSDDDPPTVSVTPGTISLAKGKKSTVTARVDGKAATSAVSWRSGNASVATVTEGAGGTAEILAVGVGQTTVTVSQDDGEAQVMVAVTAATVESLAITPMAPMVAAGTTAELTATATLSDGTMSNVSTTAEWTSSDVTKATVSATGQLRGLAVGTSTLTAKLGDKMATATATVTAATLSSIAVTPAMASRPVGLTQQYAATGTFSDGTTADITSSVTWSTTDAALATISNVAGSVGLATAVAAGTVSVRATMSGVTGTAMLTVTNITLVSIAVAPATFNLPIGATQAFTATGTYSDSSTADITAQVTWTSSDDARATVAATGVVTGVALGAATITATMGAITGTATVEVVAPVIATIAVAPAAVTLDVGGTQQYTATATYTDGSTLDITATATWASSDTNVATITSTGLATALAATTTNITATQDGVTGTAALTVRVLMTITIAPVADLAQGTSKQLVATGTFSDTSTMDLTALATWTTSDATGITVSDAEGTKGLATGVSLAGATITATVGAIAGNLAIAGCYIVVNEVQVAGSGSGNAANEWVELASKCTAEQNLTGLRLVYRAATGTSDVPLLDLTGTIAAGGYNFYVHTFFAASYPTASASFGNGNTGNLAGAGGALGLRIGTAGALLDSMGYGSVLATNAFVEGTAFGTLSGGSSAARIPDKTDTNNNVVDFAVRAAPTPGASNGN